MLRTMKYGILAGAMMAGLMTSSAHAQSFTPAQQEEINAMIRSYILDNPSIIFEAADKHQAQQQEEQAKKAEVSIKENLEYLTRAEAPSTGNPDGDVTVVEFFDYNCGYCKKALPDIQSLTKDDSNIRVVFVEMPILGPTSRTAALWALASKRQDKYFEYHVELMNHQGAKEDADLAKLAEKIGLDVEQMKKDVESEAVQNELEKDMEVARQIGVQGTPAFVVGTQFIPGYVGEEGIKQAIEQARAGDKAE